MTTPPELRAAFARVETERLLLAAVTPDDVDACFAIHGNPETYRFHPDGVTHSRERSVAQVEGWVHEWQELGLGFWAVRLRSDPHVIGFGGLSMRAFHDRQVLNTYYRFEPAAWGNGYATEMATAAAELAHRFLPDIPVIVRTRPGNAAAEAVATKIGLVHAPSLDDHLLTYVSHWKRSA